MNVLVTGGAGYIGSHTVRLLVARGYRVMVLDDLSSGHRELVGSIPLTVGDCGDAVLLNKIFSNTPTDAVIHFAGSSLVGESIRHPSRYYHNNVVKGLSLLNAMAAAGVRLFIFSSTAAVYGEPLEVPIRENHLVIPANPYGATKLALEQAASWYGTAYGIRHISLRYFNAAGADPAGDIGEDHEPETHLIPLVLKVAAGEMSCLEVYGCDYPTPDGTCIRDYIHVNDLAAAHVLALEALAAGGASGAYNLGSGAGYSVLEVIRAAEEVTGRPVAFRQAARRPGDPAVLVAASSRIKAELGWQPGITGLHEIIATAWRWHCRQVRFGRRPAGAGEITKKQDQSVNI